MFRVLVIGDVIGKPGRKILSQHLPALRSELRTDFVILNGENSAGGFGITEPIFKEFMDMGVNVVTSGNHIWDKKEAMGLINREGRLLRPLNYAPGAPGNGAFHGTTPDGTPFVVANLMGRVFMPPVDCPFRAFDKLCKETPEVLIRLVDFHAEATSEKQAFGWHTDGRAAACWGTHSHVPTADLTVLPEGCAYVSDVGLTGGTEGVIGMERAESLYRFKTGMPTRYSPAKGRPIINALFLEIDDTQGTTTEARRIQIRDYEDKASWQSVSR